MNNANLENFPPICEHRVGQKVQQEKMAVTVKGKKIEAMAAGICTDCLQQLLEKYSIICRHCNEPILPFDPVTGVHPKGEELYYTHKRCFPVADCFCGRWGLGELVPFDKI